MNWGKGRKKGATITFGLGLNQEGGSVRGGESISGWMGPFETGHICISSLRYLQRSCCLIAVHLNDIISM